MNAVKTFTKIIITNVTTQAVVLTLPFTPENEKKADTYARAQNTHNPHAGMISVHYA